MVLTNISIFWSPCLVHTRISRTRPGIRIFPGTAAADVSVVAPPLNFAALLGSFHAQSRSLVHSGTVFRTHCASEMRVDLRRTLVKEAFVGQRSIQS